MNPHPALTKTQHTQRVDTTLVVFKCFSLIYCVQPWHAFTILLQHSVFWLLTYWSLFYIIYCFNIYKTLSITARYSTDNNVNKHDMATET